MKSFWKDLPIPFTVLAPMEGVTDVVFRQIITEIGRPDVFFTEFTSCDGLQSCGSEKVAESLRFTDEQKPVVVQIWGFNPENFYKTAKYCSELGFSGIDINMGCPDSTIVKKGACSGLINNPTLAKEIIQATKEGSRLPVSVKTRLGYNSLQLDEWIGFLLKQDLDAIILHLRTVKEMSKVEAHWEEMSSILALRDRFSPKTIVVGNGDIMSLSEIDEKHKLYGCEGYMIGRGIFNNPWLFNRAMNADAISASERLALYKSHIELYVKTWGTNKNPAVLYKFSKTYVNKFSGAAALREKIVGSKNAREMIEIIDNYEAPTTLRSGYLLPSLRREQNPSEAKIASLSSAGLRSRFSRTGIK